MLMLLEEKEELEMILVVILISGFVTYVSDIFQIIVFYFYLS